MYVHRYYENGILTGPLILDTRLNHKITRFIKDSAFNISTLFCK